MLEDGEGGSEEEKLKMLYLISLFKMQWSELPCYVFLFMFYFFYEWVSKMEAEFI